MEISRRTVVGGKGTSRDVHPPSERQRKGFSGGREDPEKRKGGDKQLRKGLT